MLLILLSSLEREEERQAMASFYTTHSKDLFRYALSILENRALAEDVLHDAWLKCLEHAETFFSVPEEKRIYWMVVVVKNTALSALKKEGRHESVDPAAWETFLLETQAPQDVQSTQGIVEIIRAMPEQYRTILELRFLQEWDSRRIAGYMDLTVSTVNTRIHRGRKLLQEKLREEGYHL